MQRGNSRLCHRRLQIYNMTFWKTAERTCYAQVSLHAQLDFVFFFIWAVCNCSLHCFLSTGLVLNVPQFLSAPVDNIWLGDLRARALWTSTATFCCLHVFCEGGSDICALLFLARRSTPVWDLTFTPPRFSLLPSGPSVPASKTWRWNRILSQCKLSFLPPPSSPQRSRPNIPAFPFSLRYRVWRKTQEDGSEEEMRMRNLERGAAVSEISGICVSSRG